MRNIDQIILSGQWEIEPISGLQLLAKYSHELQLVQSGIPIDYSEQRAALEPIILNSSVGRPGLTSSNLPENSIVKLSLSGAMRLDNGLSSRGVKQLTQDIAQADANPNIKGILLEVNSPGGEVMAGTELKNALDDVRHNGQTKVLVYAQQLASAAVRGTLPADYILASSESAYVGSVGTMVSLDKESLDYMRETVVDVYADQSTEKNDTFRALMEGDFKPLKKMLTENNQHFINEVQAYRLLRGTSKEVAQVTAGKLFTADVALERGLIDGIGTFGQAVEKLQSLIKSSPEQRDFLNTNSETMNFNSITSFIANLIPGLNSKLGLKLQENASADDVINAVNEAKSLDDRLAAFKAEIEQEQSTKLSEMSAKVDTLTASFEAMKTENDRLEAERVELEAKQTELNDQITALMSAKAELQSKIVELKGKQETVAPDGTSETVNSGAPAPAIFNTAQHFFAQTTGLGSEY